MEINKFVYNMEKQTKDENKVQENGNAFKYTSLKKFNGFEKPTIWTKFSRLAATTNSVNLGQGFPDWESPSFFLEALQRNISNPNANHQYTRAFGNIKLVESIARNYEGLFKRKIDPLSEVLVTNGACALLYDAMTAFIEEGDEVLLIEPFYDCYLPQVQFVGGKVVGIPMIPPKFRNKSEYEDLSNTSIKDEWKIDMQALKRALNERTKLLLLNTPNNPTGKILSYKELQEIADLLADYPRVIVLMDEVYEHMVFDEYTTLPRMATLEGMWDRTISIMSAGKIFSATGIRVGWTIGPKNLIKSMSTVHQYSSFCLYDPIQLTIADSLDKANEPYLGHDNYYKWLRAHYRESRNYFVERFAKVKGINVNFWLPEGGYFVIADISSNETSKKFLLEDDEENIEYTKDFNYLLDLANNKKVIGIPLTPFFTEENKLYGANFIRFAYCKKKQTLDKALGNL